MPSDNFHTNVFVPVCCLIFSVNIWQATKHLVMVMYIKLSDCLIAFKQCLYPNNFLLIFLIFTFRLSICTGTNWEMKFQFASVEVVEPNYHLASKFCQIYKMMDELYDMVSPAKPSYQ